MPDRDPLVVVAAAIVDVGPPWRLLAARRRGPAAMAGWWEFPGGKVEPGESDRAALARECLEELGVRVLVGARLGGEVPTYDRRGVLRVFAVSILAGEPHPLKHAELRWLGSAEVDDLAWIPNDRGYLELIRCRPGAVPPTPTMEGP